MVARLRKRTFGGISIPVGVLTTSGVDSIPGRYTPSSIRETCQDETHPGPPYKTGGALAVRRVRISIFPTASVDVTFNTQRYKGIFYCTRLGSGGMPTIGSLPTSTYNHDTYATKGWARARPGNPAAQMGQFLVELRDIPVLPLRMLAKLKNFQSLGHEYLNVQFGWLPFVQDLKNMVQLTHNLSRHLAQLRRDNGKSIRRKLTVFQNTVVTPQADTNFSVFPSLVSGFYESGQSFTAKGSIKTDERHTFSGRFRYFVKDIDSPAYDRRAMAVLYGVLPTPSLLYEVMPWSWLIDWFSNVGDVLSNMSANAVDNLVAEYAYGMTSFVQEETYSASVRLKGVTGTLVTGCSKFTETKLRSAASPFGFGLTSGNLSGYQMSILGALGISRHF